MLICDTHADTLYTRCTAPAGTAFDISAGMLTEHPEETRLQVLALYVCTGGMEERPTIVQRELAMLEVLKKEGFRQVTKVDDALPGQANCMLSIEGCEAFGGRPEEIGRFAALGVRLAALMWNNENGIGHPAVSGSKEGLTPFGREVVRLLRENRIAVDISHLNERGAEEVLDADVPPLASHSCAYRLCAHPRNLTDAQLKALFRAGGFVGVNFYPSFLRPSGTAEADTVIDHMAYMCDLGGEDCVGLGSDFDGIETHPAGLRTAADVPALLRRMEKRGFGGKLIEKIAGENFRRYMRLIDA